MVERMVVESWWGGWRWSHGGEDGGVVMVGRMEGEPNGCLVDGWKVEPNCCLLDGWKGEPNGWLVDGWKGKQMVAK